MLALSLRAAHLERGWAYQHFVGRLHVGKLYELIKRHLARNRAAGRVLRSPHWRTAVAPDRRGRALDQEREPEEAGKWKVRTAGRGGNQLDIDACAVPAHAAGAVNRRAHLEKLRAGAPTLPRGMRGCLTCRRPRADDRTHDRSRGGAPVGPLPGARVRRGLETNRWRR